MQKGTTLEQMVAFEVAGEIWSRYLKDDVDVDIYVEMSDSLPENVIGGALPGVVAQAEYSDLYMGLSNDITTNDDQIAVDHLPSAKSSKSSKKWKKRQKGQ